LAGLELPLGEAWNPPAKGSHRIHAGKLAVSAQLALQDEAFKNIISFYAAAMISDNHDNGMGYPHPFNTATEAPVAKIWDIAMQEELDAIGQHYVCGD
jgi:hypothetical protein